MTGAGAGLVFVVICHNLTFVWFSAVPCEPMRAPDPLLSLRVTADSPTVIKYFCVHKIFVRNLADNAAITGYQVLGSWMWAGDKEACYETLNYSRAPGTDVTVSCCERSLIV